MIIEKLASIENEIKLKIKDKRKIHSDLLIIAVSKTFSINHILPLIHHGHLHFGENKIQEATWIFKYQIKEKIFLYWFKIQEVGLETYLYRKEK